MPSQNELDRVYLQVAQSHAILSKAIRKKVGACLVTASGIIIPGYNGTPPGADNSCEIADENGQFVTKDNVIHAELNCVLKAAKEGVSCVGSTAYITMAPCVRCAAMLSSAGVTRIVYLEEYRDNAGIFEAISNGISVFRYNAGLAQLT